MKFIEQTGDNSLVIGLGDVTRADGRVGLWIIEAEGKASDRRKKVIRNRFLFPDDDEQKRIDSGEKYVDIAMDFFRRTVDEYRDEKKQYTANSD